jgi:hypothetical protein
MSSRNTCRNIKHFIFLTILHSSLEILEQNKRNEIFWCCCFISTCEVYFKKTFIKDRNY